jgi:hypothetical protein
VLKAAGELSAPTVPSKIVALWNNFHALAAKLKMLEPAGAKSQPALDHSR